MKSPDEWFRELPPITKTFFVVLVGTALLIYTQVIGVRSLYYDSTLIGKNFHIWRLFTSFLYFGPLSWNWLMKMGLFISYLHELERVHYFTIPKRAELITMFAFAFVGCYIIDYVFVQTYFFATILVMFTVYVWSRKTPKEAIGIYGFRFKHWHVPFVMGFISLLLGDDATQVIAGILLGHLYHFLADIVPKRYGRTPIWTPRFLQTWAERKWSTAAPAPVPDFRRTQGYRLE
jgi:Derlin-2/3